MGSEVSAPFDQAGPGPDSARRAGRVDPVADTRFDSEEAFAAAAPHISEAHAARVLEGLFQEPAEPRQLGRYAVLGVRGRGGMGTVFEAFDRTLDRRVAIKMLRRSPRQDAAPRLLREAQAMAKLSHPNVVQVYEVAQVDGQTIVVMELVEGEDLEQWVHQEPRPSWRECVRVYLQVGRGLAAAHAQGLVHRDFKPSNAIVDHEGRARLLDFGLVRRVVSPGDPPAVTSHEDRDHGPASQDSLTRTGTVLGTPAYMPPEQLAGGEADARSDQFSFCAALYEAVYGERPFVGTSIHALALATTTGAVRPAPRDTSVPTALRRILLRGLEPKPNERWPTMDALLSSLQRRVAPRTRLVVGLGIAGGLVTVGVGLGTTRYAEILHRCTGAPAQLHDTWNDTRRGQIRAALVGTELPYAAATWERVEARLDAQAQAWTDAYTEVCEATRVRQEQSEADLSLRMSCLREHRVALHTTVRVLAQADASVVQSAVDLLADLPSLSRCDDAERLRRQQQRTPPPEDPQVARQVESLRDRLAQIRADHSAGRLTPALEQIEPAIQQAEALGYAPARAEAMLLRGTLRESNGQYAAAEQDLVQAHAWAAEHGHDEVVLDTANALALVVGQRQARHAEGLVWGRTALPLAARSDRAVTRVEVADTLGSVLNAQGKYDQAQARYEQALRHAEHALDSDHPTIARSLNNLGNVLLRQGHYEQAERHYRRALQLKERALGPDHPDVGRSLNNLGIVLHTRGRYAEAEHEHRRALELRQRVLGPDHPDVAESTHSLASTLYSQGRIEQATQLLRRALELRQRVLGPDHPGVAESAHNLAIVLESQGQYEAAQVQLRRVLQIWEGTLGADHPRVAHATYTLGSLLHGQQRYEEAERLLRRALAIWERTQGAEHPDLAFPLTSLAQIRRTSHDLDTAREYAERALSLRMASSVAPGLLAEARFVLAQVLWSDPTEHDRARTLARQARSSLAALDSDREAADLLAQLDRWSAEHGVR